MSKLVNRKLQLLGLLLLFLVLPAYASEKPQHKDEEFDSSELIFDHVGDNHDWHLWDLTGENGHKLPVSFPLPIILINPDNFNVDVFLSSEFHHGESTVKKGDVTYFMQKQTIYYTDAKGTLAQDKDGKISNKKPIDLSITKNISSMLFVALIMLIVFMSVAKAYNKHPGESPKGMQGFFEPIIVFIKDDIAIPNIGAKYSRYLPYLLTVFFFIWFNNMLGIIPLFPGGANVTGNIAVTMVLAVFTLLIVNLTASKGYWKHIFATPGLPKVLLILMIPIELISIFTKPFALMIRLFANITAGHIVVLCLMSLIFIFKSAWLAFGSVPLVLFIDVLELFVAILQAYIFTMLSALFIGLAVQEHH